MDGGRPQQGVPNAKAFRSAPAVQALLIQAISFALVLVVAYAMSALTNNQLSIGGAAILQGVVAASISRWRDMAAWWAPIQLLFPMAAIIVPAMHLPTWIFLVAFILLLGLFWTTFRTQVPYYPSTPAVWEAVAALLPRERSVRCIDIGSGFGGFILRMSALRPESVFTGIEVAPLPWLVSALRAATGRSNARFVRGNYERLDLADFDVVFAYLSPAAMPSLWRKASAEMRPGTLLLSCEFDIPGIEPHIVKRASKDTAPLYGWRF
ncbi:class I SAM-dependent methyltransferase [Noviherbaspirillum sp.]|uniref:class I SAM-dependent methyltransferase n=1 Tax=Noviherbaspirillum sp. TaxID=1926288 RepID=UPI002B49005D|nr:class I SAM-dependent methyltransferase [Noviherbaspirillum sp.]HJV81324.1 class I SAM-dependent methyltransferase [Noviherbaspirillum sp.]